MASTKLKVQFSPCETSQTSQYDGLIPVGWLSNRHNALEHCTRSVGGMSRLTVLRSDPAIATQSFKAGSRQPNSFRAARLDVGCMSADSRAHLAGRSSRAYFPSRCSTGRSRRGLFWSGTGSGSKVCGEKPRLSCVGANLGRATSLLRCHPVSQW